MGISCGDICDEVVVGLQKLGFTLPEDDDHGPILDALSDCHLVPMKAVTDPERGYAAKCCPERQSDVEGRIAEVLAAAFHVEPESPNFNVWETSLTVSRKILRQVLAEFRPDLFEIPETEVTNATE